MNKKPLRVVFMGTPQIAAASLDAIVKSGFNVVGVVTGIDKPAGRGQKICISEVKKYALDKGIHLLQPENLKSEEFIGELKALQPDVQVIVAFRLLPRSVWSLPTYGTFNMHASLLPHYRGAAPINHAIINGETKTGVTTFFLDDHIDTGQIIDRKEVEISESDTAGTLHDKLMSLGSQLVVETLEKIASGNLLTTPQEQFMVPGISLKNAPKIFRDDCRIVWQGQVRDIRNFIRGLSPTPGAFTELKTTSGNITSVKIFEAEAIQSNHSHTPGKIFSDSKEYLRIAGSDGYLDIKYLQLSGKRKMSTAEFLRGCGIDVNYPI